MTALDTLNCIEQLERSLSKFRSFSQLLNALIVLLICSFEGTSFYYLHITAHTLYWIEQFEGSLSPGVFCVSIHDCTSKSCWSLFDNKPSYKSFPNFPYLEKLKKPTPSFVGSFMTSNHGGSLTWSCLVPLSTLKRLNIG